MQNYVAETPVSADGEIISVRDANGDTVLFSVSLGGRILCLRPDPASDTGWSQSPTGLSVNTNPPKGSGARVAACKEADGKLVVFAIASGDGLSLQFVRETSTGWSAPGTVGLTANPSPILAVSATEFEGEIYIAYFVSQYPGPAVAQSGPAPFLGWVGKWSGAQHSLNDQFSTPLSSFDFLPGKFDGGNLAFFNVQTPQIYTRLTNKYLKGPIYTDEHSGAHLDLEVWRPVADDGYHIVGDVALRVNGYPHRPPQMAALTVTSNVSAIDGGGEPLMAPSDFRQIWNDSGAGPHTQDGSFWLAERDGYVPLGHLVHNSESQTPPPFPGFVMIRKDFTVLGSDYKPRENPLPHYPEDVNENLIWNNEGRHGGQRCAVDRIEPIGDSGILAGTFYAHNDYTKPGDCYCLATKPVLHSAIKASNPGTGTILSRATDAAIARLATTLDNRGQTRFFAILADGKLVVLDPHTKSWVPLDVHTGYKELAAASGVAGSGHLEIFVIDSKRRICHARENAAGPNGWDRVVPIESAHQFSRLTVTRAADGHSECFATTAKGELFRIFQDPSSTNWTTELVEVEDLRRVVEIRTFTTELTVTDASGAALAMSPVSVWSDDLTLVTINGSVQFLDDDLPVAVKTDILGTLKLVIGATDLNTPVFHVRTAGMRPDECITLEPNAHIQKTLREVQGPTLQKELGVEKSKADAAAMAINAAMSLGVKKAPKSPAHLLLSAETGLHYRPAGAPSASLLDVSAIPDQAWRIEIAHGTVRFTTLEAGQAAPVALAGHPGVAANAFGILDWLDDIGDLAAAVADGIVDEITYSISKAVDAINATINFVLDGIQYVFHKALDRIEQLFDIVATVFHAIGAAFEDLVKWLGFLFSWPDILRTKDALSHVVLQTLPFLKNSVEDIRGRAIGGIAQAKTWLQENTDTLVNVFGAGDSISSLRKPLPKNVSDQTSGTNIFMDGFVAHANGSNGVRARALAMAMPEVDDSINRLMSAFDTHANENGDFPKSKGFAEAVKSLEKIKASPDQFLNLLVQAVIRVIEGVAEAALDLAAAIVDKVCDALVALIDWAIKVLTQPLDIPYLPALYAAVTASVDSEKGSPLTMLDLGCLICAIPATIARKLLSKDHTAFFPDQSSLDQFKSTYTTDWLGHSSRGHLTTAAFATPEPADNRSFRDLLAELSGYASGFNLGAYAFVEGYLDSFPESLGESTSSGPNQYVGLLALALEFTLFVTTCPALLDPTNRKGFGTEAGAPITNLMWLVTGWLPAGFDTVFLALSINSERFDDNGVIARNAGTVGIIVDFVAQIGAVVGSIVAAAISGIPNTTLTLEYTAATTATVVSGLVKLARVPTISAAITTASEGTLTKEAIAILVGLVDGASDLAAAVATFAATNAYIALPDDQPQAAPQAAMAMV